MPLNTRLGASLTLWFRVIPPPKGRLAATSRPPAHTIPAHGSPQPAAFGSARLRSADGCAYRGDCDARVRACARGGPPGRSDATGLRPPNPQSGQTSGSAGNTHATDRWVRLGQTGRIQASGAQLQALRGRYRRV